MEVSALSCLFCAFGLEKLRQIPGAEEVTIKVNKAKAEIDVAEGLKLAALTFDRDVKKLSCCAT